MSRRLWENFHKHSVCSTKLARTYIVTKKVFETKRRCDVKTQIRIISNGTNVFMWKWIMSLLPGCMWSVWLKCGVSSSLGKSSIKHKHCQWQKALMRPWDLERECLLWNLNVWTFELDGRRLGLVHVLSVSDVTVWHFFFILLWLSNNDILAITTMSSTCTSMSSLATPPPTLSMLPHFDSLLNNEKQGSNRNLHFCVKPSSLLKSAVIKRPKVFSTCVLIFYINKLL